MDWSQLNITLDMGARGDTYPYCVIHFGQEEYNCFSFLYNNDMQIHDTILWLRDVMGIVLVLSTIISIVKQLPSIIKDGYFKFSESSDLYVAGYQMDNNR